MSPKELRIWALILGGIAMLAVQYSIPTLWEADGYYHIRMAEAVRREGPVKKFHWARYSYFATNFADKDFLYHVLLIPFTAFSGFFPGAKAAAVFFAFLLFLAYFYVLKERAGGAWAPPFLILFLLSSHFLSALSRPRPMVAAIALMLLGIHWALQRKSARLFGVAFCYGFLHITAPLVPAFALLIEWMRRQDPEDGTFSWRPFLASSGGVLLSWLLHPNFPNNLLFMWLNLILVPIYAAKGGILELGGEFFPLNSRDLFMSYPVILPGLLLLIWASFDRPAKTRFQTKALFIISSLFLIGGFFSQRYLIHGYPVFLLWMASYLTDMYGTVATVPYRTKWTMGLGILLAGSITFNGIKAQAQVEKIVNSHYEAVGKWMRENLPPGEVIFHANWSDSQYLIGLNPQDDYFVTLDPIYMYAWNKDLYALYRDVAFGRAADPYTVLRNAFKVRYGYAGRNYFSPLIRQIETDKRFRILAQDGLGVIFEAIP
ncbi:MAG: hypothetical protein A3A86_00345 [Elusimicrobia bacterium RIFCSPLOWO2_01_FULL_60_11]|nr:MAG: hypothetical protein A3A86_00345 [Elusimicrobia bacterium RIFCSPLOWO2_01_FULL_60_11]